MNPWRTLSGLRREIWVLCAAMLINRAGTMVMPFLVLYLNRELGLPAERAGLALTAFGIGSLATAPLAGRLADRIGALGLMRLSLVLSGFLILALPLARTFPAVLVMTFAWAVAGEAFRPGNLALLSALASPEQRKAAFALNRLAINLGMSVGPAAGGFLAALSFGWLFWVDGLTTLAAAAVLVLFLRAGAVRAAADAASGPRAGNGTARGALRDRRFLAFLLALLPSGLIFFQLTGALPLYLVRDLHLPEWAFGTLFTVNTLLIVALEVPLNAATAAWPHRASLPLGALLCGVGFAATGLVSGFSGAVASVVLWTFGEMVLFPGSSAAVSDLAPASRRGEYMGLYTMVFSLSLAVGPYLGTSMLERMGPRVLWGGCALLGTASSLALYAVWRGFVPPLPMAEEIPAEAS